MRRSGKFSAGMFVTCVRLKSATDRARSNYTTTKVGKQSKDAHQITKTETVDDDSMRWKQKITQ